MESDGDWDKIYEHFQQANTDRPSMLQPSFRMTVDLIPQLRNHPGFKDVMLSIVTSLLCFTVPGKTSIIKMYGKSGNVFEVRYWQDHRGNIDESTETSADTDSALY